MSARAELRRKLGVLATAFAAGLVLILIGVSILDSRAFVGGTLVAMFVVVAFGYHWFRCPSCKHSILHYTVKEMRAWMSGGPRHCPFCESDFAATDRRAVRPGESARNSALRLVDWDLGEAGRSQCRAQERWPDDH